MREQSQLTPEEARWVKRLQRVLRECPSSRLEFNTTGDPVVTVFDGDKGEEIEAEHARGRGEFSSAITECGADLAELNFPGPVHATAG